MKNIIFTTAVFGSLTFIGCSSAYRTAQTPDDVYFSEGPVRQEVVRNEKSAQPEGYTSYWERQDENMLRMKVNDRERWGAVDDIDYWQGYNNNYWVNYNTMYNSPWGMNQWNSWNNPWAMNNPWAWNRPHGFNSHFNNNWGWNSGWGMGFGNNFGWNNWGIGFNSWNNNWSNPACWNRPITVINKFPVSTTANRSGSSLGGYSNYNYNRSSSGLNKPNNNVNPGTSRSIWENSNSGQSGNRSGSSLFRTVTRPSSSSNSGATYDRPARTFDTNSGGSSSPARSSGGGSSSGGSSGSSSRGGRGG
jgi:hypothetical protein